MPRFALKTTLSVVCLLLVQSAALAGKGGYTAAQGGVHVSGYWRSNGTYVAPYNRSAPTKKSGSTYGSFMLPPVERPNADFPDEYVRPPQRTVTPVQAKLVAEYYYPGAPGTTVINPGGPLKRPSIFVDPIK